MADPGPGTPLPDPFEGTAYRTVRRLGEGGIGELFVVEHIEIGRLFAAKALRLHLVGVPQIVDRLRLEGQALARLNHPNVISVEGSDITPEGRPFLIMELLRGRTLTQELEERGALAVGVALDYATQLLAALEAVHQHGVVHRDVRPDNVFVAATRDGATGVKLVDFGVAQVLNPEGARGSRVDERADLYGAALVLYTMLAGRGPFDRSRGDHAAIEAHSAETPAPPSRYARQPIPSELDALLLQALDKDADSRHGSAREFREHLERLVALLARPAGWLETTQYDGQAAPAESAAPTHVPRARRREGEPDLARFTKRTLAITVILAVSGLILSGMAVVGAAAFFRGAR